MYGITENVAVLTDLNIADTPNYQSFLNIFNTNNLLVFKEKNIPRTNCHFRVEFHQINTFLITVVEWPVVVLRLGRGQETYGLMK